jgi:hypothetical protein
MRIPAAWLTCDEFVDCKRDALGREPHEGETTHERMLERVACKLGLEVRLRPGSPEPLKAPRARVMVIARAGVAFEGAYGEALAWLMAGAPDADARAQARADRLALESPEPGPAAAPARRL